MSIWAEMSYNKFKNRKTEYCEDKVEVIDLCSWECLRELELADSRLSVEDVYNEMWDEE